MTIRVPRSFETIHFAEFRRELNESIIPLRVSATAAHGFHAAVRRAVVDGILFSDIAASPHVAQRTPELIDRSGDPYYKLSLNLSGSCMIAQDGREAVLQLGDMALYDTSRPYTLVSDDHHHGLVMMFPRSELSLPVHAVRGLTATRLESQSGVTSAVGSFLTQVSQQIHDAQSSMGTRFARNTLELVKTVLISKMSEQGELVRSVSDIWPQANEHIDRHLSEPDLSVESVATALHVSTRHLQSVFQRKGTTVSTQIRVLRLERCRRDLLDPELVAIPVAQIARSWGFHDPAHFSRLFRERFDSSPQKYRLTHRLSTEDHR